MPSHTKAAPLRSPRYTPLFRQNATAHGEPRPQVLLSPASSPILVQVPAVHSYKENSAHAFSLPTPPCFVNKQGGLHRDPGRGSFSLRGQTTANHKRTGVSVLRKREMNPLRGIKRDVLHPINRSAAVAVWSMRVAMVIGPTPPGTGVIMLARAAAPS